MCLDASATTVAPRLIGATLESVDALGVRTSGRIVEVEAYRGTGDAAAHSAAGCTPRNRTMFGPSGRLYVYFVYGMHWCANVVCGPEGVGDAVLIRALEPLDGIDTLRRRRGGRVLDRNLANGPAKLCAALGITGACDGQDLCAGSTATTTVVKDVVVRDVVVKDVVTPNAAARSAATQDSAAPTATPSVQVRLRLPPVGAHRPDVATSPRIGISKSRELPWRWFERGSDHVSRRAPAAVTRPSQTAVNRQSPGAVNRQSPAAVSRSPAAASRR